MQDFLMTLLLWLIIAVLFCVSINIFLAQLAWTAPDLPTRYPIVIRYTDMRLEAIAAMFDQEELDQEELESEEPVENEEVE